MDLWRRYRRHAEEISALLKSFIPVPVSQEAVVAYADEAARERVHQEAANKLTAGKRQDLALLVVRVILVAETHSAIAEFDQPPVRDGDAMRVASQIFQHTSG